MTAAPLILIAVALVLVGLALVRAGGGRDPGPSLYEISETFGGPLQPYVARRHQERRRHLLVAQLPSALDLVAVALAAGAPVGVALGVAASRVGQPLSEELSRVDRDLALGATRADAYRGLADRVGGDEFAALAAALERADTLGAPISGVIEAQADALRAQGERRALERAARAGPKIQLVIALMMVPATLALVIGVLLLELTRQIGAVVGSG